MIAYQSTKDDAIMPPKRKITKATAGDEQAGSSAKKSKRSDTIDEWVRGLSESKHSDKVLEAMFKIWKGLDDLDPEEVSAEELSALAGLGERYKAERSDLRSETDKLFARKFGTDALKENVPTKLLQRAAEDGTELIDGENLEQDDFDDIVQSAETRLEWLACKQRPFKGKLYIAMWRHICVSTNVSPTDIICKRRFLQFEHDFADDLGVKYGVPDWAQDFCGMLTDLALGAHCLRGNMSLLSWFIRYYMAYITNERRRVPFDDHDTGEPFLDVFAQVVAQSNGESSLDVLRRQVGKVWKQKAGRSLPWHYDAMILIERAAVGKGKKPTSRADALTGPFEGVFRVPTRCLTRLSGALGDIAYDGSRVHPEVAVVAHMKRKARIGLGDELDIATVHKLRLKSFVADECFMLKRSRNVAASIELEPRSIEEIIEAVLKPKATEDS
jgi:hypothetical protein